MWIRGKASIDIAAPPDAIWEWLVDRDKQKAWMKDEIEWLPVDTSQLHAGYRGTEIMQFPQGPSEARIELVEYEPPRRMVAKQEHEWFSSRATFELSAAGAGTRVVSSVRIRYRSFKTWIQLLPIVPFYSRVIKTGLKDLKQLVEGGA